MTQLGDSSNAQAIFERFLAIQERVYGPNHPSRPGAKRLRKCGSHYRRNKSITNNTETYYLSFPCFRRFDYHPNW